MDFPASPMLSSKHPQPLYSPHLGTMDLGLDPSDPLNLLLNLHNSASGHTSMDESSPEGATPPDWSQLSDLWPDDPVMQHKPYADVLDFSDISALPMDIDFNPSIAIDPSALHIDPMKYNFNSSYTYQSPVPSYNDLLASHFSFSFSNPSDTSLHSQRRLSVTSSESSSSASLSPMPEPAPATLLKHDTDVALAPPTDIEPKHANEPAAELAERVRQSAGITVALPINAHLQALQRNQAPPSAHSATPKLPIPRLPRPSSQSVKSHSTVSSAASTPPPSTPSPPPAQATPSTAQVPPPPRTKTSHTTIERRYRTNLNARIQSLRMAVPALRVVEDRDGKKKAPNKVLVSGDPTQFEGENVVSFGGVVDVVDERGFIDGVKVARKCSKANVLGKAVEYIRVLKKREMRLKAEQAGLKMLILGLVGGPALLKEWEREWRERFGGEEKDEVDGEMDADMDDEESDEEQDDEVENGRKRKRGKVSSPVTAPVPKQKKPTPDANGTVPEKRKRGRPRKIVPVVPAIQDEAMEAPQNTSNEQGQTPQQYLLATFALFSFFNSPLTSTSSYHAKEHAGTVLNAPAYPGGSQPWGLAEYIHVFHLLVSLLVLLSLVSSWLGYGGTTGSLMGLIRTFRKERRSRAEWIKLGEECVLTGSKQPISIATRLQIYHHLTAWTTPSSDSIATAALILYGTPGVLGGLARAKARMVWTCARSRLGARSHTRAAVCERVVFEEMSVDEAFERLGSEMDLGGECGDGLTEILGRALVKERLRKHLGSLFVGVVCGREGREGEGEESIRCEEQEREGAVEAAKELGGRVGELGRRVERVWRTPLALGREVDWKDDDREEGGVEGDIGALLKALVLYHRVLMVPSWPLCVGGKVKVDGDLQMLRRVLGSRVFEAWGALEEARDRVVDMVVVLDRRSVGLD